MPNIDPDFFNSVSRELLTKLDRLKYFTKRGPAIDLYHEEVIRNALTNMLPGRYSLKTGFLFAEGGASSEQIDLIIVDENDVSSYYFREGNYAVVHPHAVVGTVEMVSSLTKKSFSDAMAKIHSAVTTAEAAGVKSRNMANLIFAFSGPKFDADKLGSWYADITDIPDDAKNYPNCLFCLNRGWINFRPARKDEPFGHYPAALEGGKKAASALTLSTFLKTIRKQALLRGMQISNPFDGTDWKDAPAADYHLRFGQGALR